MIVSDAILDAAHEHTATEVLRVFADVARSAIRHAGRPSKSSVNKLARLLVQAKIFAGMWGARSAREAVDDEPTLPLDTVTFSESSPSGEKRMGSHWVSTQRAKAGGYWRRNRGRRAKTPVVVRREDAQGYANVHQEPGKIVVGPRFDTLTPAQQQHTLQHEVGHAISDDMLKDGSAFELSDAGAFGPKMKDGTILGINGQFTPGENVAEAAGLLLGDEWEFLLEKYPEAFRAVGKRLLAMGYKLPAKAEKALGAHFTESRYEKAAARATDPYPTIPGFLPETVEQAAWELPFDQAITAMSTDAAMKRLRGELARKYQVDDASEIATRVLDDLTERTKKAFTKELEAGPDVGRFKQRVHDNIGRWSANYVENLWRTEIARSYSEGRYRQVLELGDAAVGYEYQTMADVDVRGNHRFDGLRAPKDHALWTDRYPPNGWRCRCLARVITRAEAEREGWLDESGELKVHLPPGFRPDFHRADSPEFGRVPA